MAPQCELLGEDAFDELSNHGYMRPALGACSDSSQSVSEEPLGIDVADIVHQKHASVGVVIIFG